MMKRAGKGGRKRATEDGTLNTGPRRGRVAKRAARKSGRKATRKTGRKAARKTRKKST